MKYFISQSWLYRFHLKILVSETLVHNCVFKKMQVNKILRFRINGKLKDKQVLIPQDLKSLG